MRLTKDTKNTIIKAAVTSIIANDLTALQRDYNTFVKEITDSFYASYQIFLNPFTKKQRETMFIYTSHMSIMENQLPRGINDIPQNEYWFYRGNQPIQIKLLDTAVTLKQSLPMFTHGKGAPGSQLPLTKPNDIKTYTSICKRYEKIRNTRDTAIETLSTALKGISSDKLLITRFPDLEPFLPSELTTNKSMMIHTKAVHKLFEGATA